MTTKHVDDLNEIVSLLIGKTITGFREIVNSPHDAVVFELDGRPRLMVYVNDKGRLGIATVGPAKKAETGGV